MSKKTTAMYTQCVMEKKTGPGSHLKSVAWIPTALARVGRNLQIKDEQGDWHDGWRVVERGETKEAEYVEKHERDYTTQRDGSDI